jgi:hypothetical protein
MALLASAALAIEVGKGSSEVNTSIREGAARHKARTLIGKTLTSIGVPKAAMPKIACLVLLGKPGCSACEEARLSLLGQSKIPVVMFELVDTDSKPSWNVPTVSNDPAYFPRTPTLLTVSPNGKILGDYAGWSQDPIWFQAFIESVRADLKGKASEVSQ